MGIMDRFEQNIERVVNNAFAKAFRSNVQPIDLVSRLRREMDNKAVATSTTRTIVPNAFTITLAPSDYDQFHDWEESLADELAGNLTEHARQQRYSFVGPIMMRFQREPHMETGVFHVVSSQQKGTVPSISTGSVPHSQPTLDINGRRYPLTEGTITLGRGSDADIVLEDTGVSRHHAHISWSNGQVTVSDMGSTNGTFVNGRKITTVSLSDQDVISLGRSRVTLLYPKAVGSHT